MRELCQMKNWRTNHEEGVYTLQYLSTAIPANANLVILFEPFEPPKGLEWRKIRSIGAGFELRVPLESCTFEKLPKVFVYVAPASKSDTPVREVKTQPSISLEFTEEDAKILASMGIKCSFQ